VRRSYGKHANPNNLITALQSGVEKFIFLGSIYPKLAPTTAKRRVFIDGYFGTN
jgi:hypothetical protein